MKDGLLFDTDILIDFLRGLQPAVSFLENADQQLRISAITAAELYAGAREKEMPALDEFLLAFEIIAVDHQISKAGGMIRNKYNKSHGVGLSDAIIAASAIATQSYLVTLNKKYFPMLKKIILPYRKF